MAVDEGLQPSATALSPLELPVRLFIRRHDSRSYTVLALTFPGVYLFSGPSGMGKTQLARVLAS